MSERETTITPEAIGLPQNVADAINSIQEFCWGRTTGCAGCPLFAGMPGESTGCIYQNFIPAEVPAQKIIDMNSYNVSGTADGLPTVGSQVRLGRWKYIVLDYIGENVLLLHYDFVNFMAFGDEADYETSRVRRYLNEEYYNELAAVVGAENIIKHRVDTTPEDGRADYGFVEDYISLMTVDSYRKYSKHIRSDGWWWTATRKSAIEESGYARNVCYVGSLGVLDWNGCDCDGGGVRPFCILKSCVLTAHS